MKGKFLTLFATIFVLSGLIFAACQPAAATEAPVVEETAAATEAPAATEAAATEAPAATEAAVATEAPAGDMTITYMDTTGFYTLDPFGTPWFTLTQAVMYDTLVQILPDGSAYEGILAESWEPSEDGLAITFKLKDGITFHDGTPWNADAAVWNLSKFLDPAWPKTINEDWASVISSFEKVDDMTIKINFISVYSPIYADLALTYMVSPTAYEELGSDNFGASPVGTGPWMPIEIVPNDHVTYQKNPNYTWGASYTNGQPAAADFFKIVFNTDQAVAYAALETGEVTFTDLGAQFLASAEENPDIEVNKGTSNSLYYLGINYKKEIFQNADFRRAIAFALDRDEIIAAAFEGEAFKTCQFLPGGTIGYNAETDAYACEKYPYDPEQANQILDDLGWVDTNGDGVRERDGAELTFPMIFNTETTTGLAAEVIQSQLADIGIALDLQPMEAAAQAEILVAEQQDFFIRPYGLVDPVILSSMVTYPNRNAFDDPQATELRNIADSKLDFAERMQAVDNMNRYLIDNNSWFPLWTPYAYVASRAELQGEMFDFVGGIIFHNATITK